MVHAITTAQKFNGYYQNIVHSIITAANSCVPVKKMGVQKSRWSEEPDQLKQETVNATNFSLSSEGISE